MYIIYDRKYTSCFEEPNNRLDVHHLGHNNIDVLTSVQHLGRPQRLIPKGKPAIFWCGPVFVDNNFNNKLHCSVTFPMRPRAVLLYFGL